MPWYGWLVLFLALASILGGLFLLRDSAGKLPLTDEQLQRIKARNAELDAQEEKEENQ